MPDPVSYLLIEPGWDVVGSDGDKVGVVREVLADLGADIFDGLVVDPGLLKPATYVGSEQVGRIVETRIELTLSSDEFGRLPDWRGAAPTGE